MIRFALVVAFIAVLPMSAFGADTIPQPVHLHSGPVSGKVEEGVSFFLGIPYAAPPVGEFRWRPPQEVTPWAEVRNSKEFGPACPQPGQQVFKVPGDKSSEDCLYLNVWTPAKKTGDKLPVMVWIHGGAFNFGSASQPEYDGKNLAKKGLVVVTLSYRLGPLGFLVHPFLSKESVQGVSGNYALLDQIAALKWIRKNIGAFGGNPDQVTVFGQSAGSRSVSLLMKKSFVEGPFSQSYSPERRTNSWL